VKCIRILVGKPVGNKPLQRSMHRWEDNIKVGLKQGVIVSIGFKQLRVRSSVGLCINMVMNLQVP
jgi:hypothetical protein